MIVTHIVPVNKHRSRVFFEEEPAFVLSNGDIGRLGLKEGGNLDEKAYKGIIREILCPEALRKAVDILKTADRTEQELERKLRESGYPDSAVNYALQYLKNRHYVDDEGFGRRYMEYRTKGKSKRQIQFELQQKGLDGQLIDQLMEESPVDEERQIRDYIRKRGWEPEKMSLEKRRKAMASLARKGFHFEAVAKIFRDFQNID
ncbi:MAG TPA: recombination regulator RecX [Candidatus Hungatella pullicola]|nr:recombination regulator RecX [Candidatus Hungatella pullicola]